MQAPHKWGFLFIKGSNSHYYLLPLLLNKKINQGSQNMFPHQYDNSYNYYQILAGFVNYNLFDQTELKLGLKIISFFSSQNLPIIP